MIIALSTVKTCHTADVKAAGYRLFNVQFRILRCRFRHTSVVTTVITFRPYLNKMDWPTHTMLRTGLD